MKTSRFTVKTLEESADGSALMFLRWFKLAHICRPIQVAGPHQSLRHVGALVGLAPQAKIQPPQIETW